MERKPNCTKKKLRPVLRCKHCQNLTDSPYGIIFTKEGKEEVICKPCGEKRKYLNN